jgi:methionyl-tRNA formyltransferase
MARIVVIGGIESTYVNAELLHDMGEEIVLFTTRGRESPGWQGVDLIDESKFRFSSKVPRIVVHSHINDYIAQIREARPDFIYSLGWQQVYSQEILGICPVVGIHESLLPVGAGAVPIANAILHGLPRTGVSLFWLDGGIDTGPLIGQLQGLLDPRTANATELYREAMDLERDLLKMFVPAINKGTAPRIPQDFAKRTCYPKVDWSRWPDSVVRRTRVYPYA